MNNFAEFLKKYSSEPAVIFAIGAVSGLVILFIITRIKKYFAFILTIIVIAVIAFYLSGRKVSDLKKVKKDDIRKIGESARDNFKKYLKENMPGFKK